MTDLVACVQTVSIWALIWQKMCYV